jgi:hypothetical protein
MVDDGAAGSFTQFGADLTASTFTVDVTGLTLSSEYRFKITASNHIGTQDSNIVKSIVADLPSTPVNAPTFAAAETNSTSIRVVMDTITQDGGSPIISYQLQRTEPGSSVFFDVIGSLTNMTVDVEQ